MKKPIIALTPGNESGSIDLYMRMAYTNAILAAGGIPVILPLSLSKEDMAQAVCTFDGFLFTGGPDVSPFAFGEETRKDCGIINEYRDALELPLFSMVYKAKKPVLAVCRGIQVMNIALGGDIYQDIPSQYDTTLQHSQVSEAHIPVHSVRLTKNGPLTRITGQQSLKVNSFHHQAIRRLAPGLLADATAPDGLIEAVYSPEHPFALGVQWHPERLAPRDEASNRLFQALINSCTK